MSLLVCVYISPKAGHMLVRFDFPVCIYILALIWIGQTSWWLSYFLYVYTYIMAISHNFVLNLEHSSIWVIPN